MVLLCQLRADQLFSKHLSACVTQTHTTTCALDLGLRGELQLRDVYFRRAAAAAAAVSVPAMGDEYIKLVL